jgi:hypothetical protein
MAVNGQYLISHYEDYHLLGLRSPVASMTGMYVLVQSHASTFNPLFYPEEGSNRFIQNAHPVAATNLTSRRVKGQITSSYNQICKCKSQALLNP